MKLTSILNTKEREYFVKNVQGNRKLEIRFTRALFKKKWWKVIESQLLNIKTKDMRMTPLILNPVQERFVNMVKKIESENRPVRIIIPKSRQQGISTIVEAIIYAKTAFSENVNSVIIADESKKSTNIFDMSKLMHEMLPEEIRSEKSKSNAKELSFSEMHSKIEIDTAENRDACRSGTYHNLHASEFAYFPHPEELMGGVNQTIPEIPGTMIILESTGNGIGNMFYDMTMKGVRGEIDYEVFFIPWFDSQEYSTRMTDADIDLEQQILEGYCPEYGDEKHYHETFSLSLGQMKWRRYCIRNKCNGDLSKFAEEYPTCLEESFQTSGNPVFSLSILEKIQATYTRPEKYRAIYVHDDTTGIGELQKSENGYVKIWHEAGKEWDYRYLVFADTGGMWGDEQKGADYSYACVYDRMERKIAASVRGHFSATFFSKIIVHLARTYSGALLALEINKYASETDEHGISVLDRIRENLNYENLYYRKTLDKMNNKETDQLGFHMNVRTKQLIVDRLIDYVKGYIDEDIHVNDSGIIDEMKTFIISQTKTGKTTWKAQEGCKDDRVDVFGGILYISDSMPVWKKSNNYTESVESHKDMFDYI